MRSTIGSLILLGAVAAAVVFVLRLTSEREPVTGRRMWGPLKRTGAVVGAFLVTSLTVGGALGALGLEPSGETSAEQLVDVLEAGGYSEAEVDCVEDRLVSEYGDVDEAADAIKDDARVFLRPVLVCRQDLGLTDEDADCFADGITDHFDVEELDADTLSRIGDSANPGDKQALAEISLVCQDVPPAVAECVIDVMAAAYPGMFEPQRMETLSAEQQQFMYDAAAECADGDG